MLGKKLATFVEVDDTTPIQKLSVTEQLRLLLRRIANEDREQLRVEDAETVYQLQLKANLLEFIYKATETVRRGEHKSVTMAISSRFAPILDETLTAPAVAGFYTVTVDKPQVDFDIEYSIRVTLEVRSY